MENIPTLLETCSDQQVVVSTSKSVQSDLSRNTDSGIKKQNEFVILNKELCKVTVIFKTN